MTRKDSKERKELIVDFIKESGSEGVKPEDIENIFEITNKNRGRIMTILRKEYPQIAGIGSPKNRRYIWKEDPIVIEKPRETHSPFLQHRYEKTNKNDEGYTDMTASMAIRNAEPDTKAVKDDTQDLVCPNPGEVWLTKESNGDVGFVYILAYSTSNDKAQVIRLYDLKTCTNPGNIMHDLRIQFSGGVLIGDLTDMYPKRRKYLIRAVANRSDEQLMKVRKEVAGILEIESFRIKTEKVVEEKIVYKELEVPEGCISEKDAEILRLKQLVDVYSGIAWGLMARPQGVPAV